MPLYEFEEGSSRKFYRIDLDGRKVLLHWGRIGTEGEHQILSFETEALAKAEYDRQREKRSYERGYRLVVDEGIPHDPEQVSRDRLVKAAPLTASPRFLFVHRAKQKFAWVEARGNVVVSIKGRRADEDKLAPTTKSYISDAAAIRERDALVAKWLGQGYELETFGSDREAKSERPKKRRLVDCSDLERVIAEDPYDDGRWEVLEDFLLQHPEDPRCEMIEAAKRRVLADEAQARGAALPLLLGKRHAGISKALGRPVWRAGYLVSCNIATSSITRFTDTKTKTMLQALLATPAARLIRAFDLMAVDPRNVAEMTSYLVQAPCARSLRLLAVSTSSTAPVPLDAATFVGLSLVELDVTGASVSLFGVGALPDLQRLGSRVGSLAELRVLLDGTAPAALTSLAIWTNADQRDGDRPTAGWLAELTEILGALPRFAPRLSELELRFNTADAAQAAAGAVASLPLQSLTVSPSGAS